MTIMPRPAPTILIVEPDDQVRPSLMHNLRQWGYRVIVSLDSDDAAARVREGRLSVDLILIDPMKQSLEQALVHGRLIRRQASAGAFATFIVVLAEHYGTALEGQNQLVGEREYVTYLEDAQQLQQLLHQLCPVEVHCRPLKAEHFQARPNP